MLLCELAPSSLASSSSQHTQHIMCAACRCRFHLVPYSVRFWVAALLMAASFCIVALSSNVTAQASRGAVKGQVYVAHALSRCIRASCCSLLTCASCASLTPLPLLVLLYPLLLCTQLVGVALVAVQGGLGEASALGLCSRHPNQLSLTAWSSGTGFAGGCRKCILTERCRVCAAVGGEVQTQPPSSVKHTLKCPPF